MLKELRISNLILMESLTIPLNEGFNVISGETGSGKSALTEALSLLLGKRADPSLMRFGTNKASIEAVFSPPYPNEFLLEMQQSGMEIDVEDLLIVKRELSLPGKGRCFINHESVHLNLLKKALPHLLAMVGQHAVKELFQEENHGKFLDLFGDLELQVGAFQEAFRHLQQLKDEQRRLSESMKHKEHQLEMLGIELQELQEANVQPGEDEALFEEYSRLINAGALLETSGHVLDVLQNDTGSVLNLLCRSQTQVVKLAKMDHGLEEFAKQWRTSILELQEAARSLERFSNAVEENPLKAEEISTRLSIVNKIKKKYGDSIDLSKEREKKLLEEMRRINEEGRHLSIVENAIEKEEKSVHDSSKDLSERRKIAAKLLEAAMEDELRALNMSKATFHVEFSSKPLSLFGQDRVEFFLTPNPGEAKIAIKSCASGGELSRILFSLHVLLAGKTAIPTLIFDEIDGNIGGMTAAIVGKKLKAISLKHQVLCITHFPQVAKPASHHIVIAKEERDGRTHSIAKILNSTSRQQELARMIGT